MSDDKIKEQDTSSRDEQQEQAKRPAGNAAGKQSESSGEAEETAEVRREETETDKVKMAQKSKVYTATRDTLFPKKITHTRTHALV